MTREEQQAITDAGAAFASTEKAKAAREKALIDKFVVCFGVLAVLGAVALLLVLVLR
jgi:hypothetical protein